MKRAANKNRTIHYTLTTLHASFISRNTEYSNIPITRSNFFFRQHGSPESAAQLLEKAAKIIEPKDPATALELYEKAAETVMTEDRPKQGR